MSGQLFGHEEKCSDQWAVIGLPLAAMYLGIAIVQDDCSPFGSLAGLVEGGYEGCCL
jgi:hypothetical protein